MPNIALSWDPGSEGSRALNLVEVERRVSLIFQQSPYRIELNKITMNEKGVKITTETEKCIENMQRNEVKNKLKEHLQLSFQPSGERMARHTLTIRPFNVAVFDYSDEQLLAAVRRSAFITDDSSILVYKNKEKKLIKLTFDRQSDAESLKKAGLRIGTWAIPKHRISYAQYFAILMCTRCMAYESHSTKDCKQSYEICSECAQKHHTFRNCPRPTPPQCINCLKKGKNANHRTLANACPEKRKILARKRKEEAEKAEEKEHLPMAKAVSRLIVKHSTIPSSQASPWANVVKGASNLKRDSQAAAAVHSTPASTVEPEKKKKSKANNILKQILVCSINAHLHNKTYPGTYNKKLNYLLGKNNIPYTDVGDDWDSQAILESIENDLETDMEFEETVIRSSPPPPNFSLSQDTPPPPIPEVDRSLVDRSLETYLYDEDSFGGSTSTLAEKEKGKKKKKKRKKNNGAKREWR